MSALMHALWDELIGSPALHARFTINTARRASNSNNREVIQVAHFVVAVPRAAACASIRATLRIYSNSSLEAASVAAVLGALAATMPLLSN